jgi:sulfide:quinone oxidoreductase
VSVPTVRNNVRRALDTLIVGGSFAGVKTAWDLRKKLPRHHRITLISDKPKTIIRASFPRVVFEDVPIDQLAFDLAKSFRGTGIEFVHDPLRRVDQAKNQIVTAQGTYNFDFLVISTGARSAYELLPGSREYAKSICDPSRIDETKKALLDFREGEFYTGASAGYTPCDGPPLEMLLGLDHRLRKLGCRDRARLSFFSDKHNLLPPGGPTTWTYLEKLFKRRNLKALLGVELTRLDEDYLYFEDGEKKPYDLCLVIPPYRGIKPLHGSGLTDERGFIPVEPTTMRARQSENYNIYAVGDAAAIPGPKQGHLALMQAGVAAAHIAWRINGKGEVPSYLPEFKCVMYLGGGTGLYLYSQWLSDGDVEVAKASRQAELSKIKFEKLFFDRRGNIGELHRTMIK